MEPALLLAAVGIGGVALLFQSKALPTEADFKKAQVKLSTNPDDADANKTAGKYTAFVLGDYFNAFPYFLKSGDKVLKQLAEHEQDPTYTDTDPKRIGMGDEWVIAAKSAPQLAKIYYDRASFWYAKAWPLLDGVWKDRTREQLRKLFQNVGVPDPKGASAPAGWKAIDTAQKAGPTTKAVRAGRMSFQVACVKTKADEYVSLEQGLPAIPGKTYDFSGWVLSDGTDDTRDVISAVFFGPQANMMGVKILLIPRDEPWWHKLEGSFVMPDGAALIQVHVGVGSKTGNIFVDDLSLKVEGKEMLKNPGLE